jgi:phosphoenolpyruvate carboxykinase (GTP)
MADYFAHWFAMGDRLGDKAPRIFYANWFRRDKAGRFIWPGFGENARVLKWMCDRVAGVACGIRTPIGLLPGEGELDMGGLNVPVHDLKELLRVDVEAWCDEVREAKGFFAQFGQRLPGRLSAQLEELEKRLCK